MRMSRSILVLILMLAALIPTPAAAAGNVQLKVAAVQFRSSFRVADNQARIAKALQQLSKQGVDVAVFPECALTGYHSRELMEPFADEVLRAEESIAAVCREEKIAAVFGSILKINGRTYDTAVVFSSKGELVERYGKVMLAGEKWATPGNHIAFFELQGVPSTVIICHDERYPELVRLPAMAGARIVYYISHESGMQNESKLAPYKAQIMARAVENRVFVVAANAPGNVADNSGSHGQSRIIKEDGNVLQEASIYGEDILVETLVIDLATHNWIQKHLKGLTGNWWRQGLDFLQRNRGRALD